MEKRILLASPRGFCMGVERAVRMLEEALRREQGTVYVRRELVHNAALMERFQSLGAVVVREVDQVPPGGTVVFSAHGVAPSVRERAGARGLRVVDTTCPLVEKVHREAARLREEGYTILLIGEPGHKEVEGVMGEAPERIRLIPSSGAPCPGCLDGIDGSRVAWLSQTTLHVDETARIVEGLRKRFPLIQGPPKSDICYATKNRQAAAKSIAVECGLFIVVGSKVTEEIKALEEPENGVVIRGFVTEEELARLYDTTRIVAVPLRYGAGVKGKVVEALYNGAAIVTTSIGAEGINDGEHVMMIKDRPSEFADAVAQLYQNPEQCLEMSRRTQEYVRRHYGVDAAWRVIQEDFL